MEEGWERRSPPLPPDRALVEARVARASTDARVVEVTPLSGGHVNTNLRVDLADGRVVVLRLYQRDRDACAREAALLRLLGDRVPVATVLHEAASAEPPSLLLSFCPGRRLCDVLPGLSATDSAVVGHSVGHDLGRIHAALEYPRAGFLGPDLEMREPIALLAHLEHMLAGRGGERLGAEVTRDLRRWIAPRAELLATSRAVLLHADFKPTNLLALGDGRWRVSAVLDWEFAFAGPPLFDVGQLLRHDEGPDLGALLPGQARPFVAGFEAGYRGAGGRLDGAWREQAAALDLVNLVGFLDDPEERPVAQGDAHRLVLRTLARWP